MEHLEVFKYRTDFLSVKDVDTKKGIVTGYFSAFNNVDSDGDIIRPGAFTKSISENGPVSIKPRVKHLLNHDVYKPLGKLLTLKEDGYGLAYESQIGNHSQGVEFLKMAESGLITEHSIGFRTTKRNQLGEKGKVKAGEPVNEILELKLYEGSSLTGWGANENTPLTGMKAELQVERTNARIDLLVKAMRDGNFTDETFHDLEIELRQLQQLSLDFLYSTKAAETALQPDNESDGLYMNLLLLNTKLSMT